MNAIRINEKISYIPASENPLSADIGIIRDGDAAWLFDVGDGAESISGLEKCDYVVLSHFHRDHTGNVGLISAREIFGSGETCRHIAGGTEIRESRTIGNLSIFPLPSSHAKGCLGLEIDGTYAFVGDGLYSKVKNGCYIYNAQLLLEEIRVLKALHAPFLLVSHYPGMIRSRDEVIAELEEIYAMRIPNEMEIAVGRKAE